MMLSIPKKILNEMIDHASVVAPVEACGILAGYDNRVEAFHRMTNIDNSQEHFALAPEEQFAVVKKIRAAGHKMLAIYHSHPASPARPSEEDIRLALTPEVIYAILSLAEEPPVIKGFLIKDDAVTEVGIEIEE